MAWKKKSKDSTEEIKEIKEIVEDKPEVEETKDESDCCHKKDDGEEEPNKNKLWCSVEIPTQSKEVIYNSRDKSTLGIMEALAELLNRTE